MSNPADLKTVHIQELVSFRLFYENCDVPCSLEDGRDRWQGLEARDRSLYRAAGIRFLERLEAVGLGVRVTDNKEVTRNIEFLLTVPPRIAYELPVPSPSTGVPTITLPNPSTSV